MKINIFDDFISFMDNGGWILMPILFIALIMLILKVISRWIFFKKCGEEGWKSLIPIYTDVTLVKISGLNWWWVLFLYISVIQNIFSYIVSYANVPYLGIISGILALLSLTSIFTKVNISYNICKKFNLNAGYIVLLVLLEPIGLLILSLSKNVNYNKDLEVCPNGLFKGNTANNNTTNNNNYYSQNDIEFCGNCGNKVRKDSNYCEHCGNKVR